MSAVLEVPQPAEPATPVGPAEPVTPAVPDEPTVPADPTPGPRDAAAGRRRRSPTARTSRRPRSAS